MSSMHTERVQVGDNSSYRQGNNYYSGPVTVVPDQREKPEPRLVVPFRRDEHFVYRDELEEVKSRCSEPGARVALYGLGGNGASKTQLAIECAYRLREQSPERWVFWVHASNQARFEEGYREIATVVQVPGWNDPKTDILNQVYHWLSDERNGPWTLIIDNADDGKVFWSAIASQSSANPTVRASKTLSKYLPTSKTGSILITSRVKKTAEELVEYPQNAFEVKSMTESLSMQLLNHKISGETTEPEDELQQLAERLDHIPLAMVQAAAYIRRMSPRMTIRKYLQELQKSDQGMEGLLRQAVRDGRRDDEDYGQGSYSILATWWISFQNILQERPSAAQLLSQMSLCDRQGIPEELLMYGYIDEIDLEDDIALLRDYSLISITTRADTFEMHRLVQFANKSWLKGRGELQLCQEKQALALEATAPLYSYETWNKLERLFTHSRLLLEFELTSFESIEARSNLFIHVGEYASSMGSYFIAEALHRQALKDKEEIIDREDFKVVINRVFLATTLNNLGKYEEAEQLLKPSLEPTKRVLGKEHPNTLLCMNDLATTLGDLGKYEEAEQLLKPSLEATERVLGKEHPDTLSCMNNLAAMLRHLGKYEEAEQLLKHSLEAIERVLGREHPNTLSCMNNLATTLRHLGKYEEAEQLLKHSLEATERVLGKEHPDTLSCMNNLAATLRHLGKYEEAEQLLKHSLEATERVLGKEHPDTLLRMNNLAAVLGDLGKYEEAEQLLKHSLEAIERVLGKEHPDTLSRMNNLAAMLGDLGKYEEAEQLLKHSLEATERVLGKEHPDTLSRMNNLATILGDLGKYEEAEQLLKHSLEATERVLGKEHPDTLLRMNNLATILGDLGKYGEAEQLLKHSLEATERVLGKEHPDTLSRMNNLATVLGDLGKYEEAEQLQR